MVKLTTVFHATVYQHSMVKGPLIFFNLLKLGSQTMNLPTESRLIDNISRDKDERGGILSIVDEKIQNVSLITCNEDTIRSNHYHFEDFHFMYVLEGQIDYFHRGLTSSTLEYIRVTRGQTIFTPPNEIHATYFPVATTLIVSSKNPRDKETYEGDTERVTIVTPQNIQALLSKLAS